MDNMAEKVKNALNSSMTSESFLSEEEKKRIRTKISALKPEKSKRVFDIMPKILTITAAAGFFLFIGGVIGQNLNTDHTSIKNGAKGTSFSQQAGQTDSFFPGVPIGTTIRGWKLTMKGASDGGKSVQSGLHQAVFDGSAVLNGTLTLTTEDDQQHPNKLFFIPDAQSVSLLPIEPDSQKIILDFSDQLSVEKMIGIKPGEEKQNITIEIDQYTINDKIGMEVPDTVHFANLIQNGKEVSQGFNLKLDDFGRLLLSDRLQKVYNQFSTSLDDNVLKSLSPFDIFQMYYYSGEKRDFKTQYALFINDPDHQKVFPTYKDYLQAIKKDEKGAANLLQLIKSANLEEKVENHSSAYIIISQESGLGFGLTKNKYGIWKVNWMPLQ